MRLRRIILDEAIQVHQGADLKKSISVEQYPGLEMYAEDQLVWFVPKDASDFYVPLSRVVYMLPLEQTVSHKIPSESRAALQELVRETEAVDGYNKEFLKQPKRKKKADGL